MLIKQSTSSALPILMVDATDGYTEETGLTLTITVRKAGSSTWSASSGTTTERGNGSYEYAPTTGEVDTLGVFEYRAVSAGARTFRGAAQVVAELPGVVASIAAGAITASAIAADAITAAKIADGAIDAATFAAGAINAAAFATDAIDANAVAASAIAEWPTNATITTAVVAGMAGSPVGSVTGAVGSVTALATDAITSAAVSAAAVTKIQGGLATASALTSVQDDTNDLQARLPAALVGGRIDASVGAMASNVVTAAAVATGAIDADALAADAATEIATAIDAALSVTHGAGAWEGSGGATAADIADAVCDEALAGHATAGTVGAALSGAATASALSTLATAVGNLPSAATIATAVWAVVVEGAHTTAGALRVMLRVLAGRRIVSGTTDTYRNLANTRDTVVATVDTDGNRSAASTLDSDP